MEPDMKLNAASVRRLREARNWSQEQLASASGLSLRTIQRVEADGTASRETRVCLAAALDVDASAFTEVPPEASPPAHLAPWKVSAMANAVAGVTLLLAAWVSDAPGIVHYIGVFFLGFAAVSYAYQSRLPADKA